jgi:hypothetical protein
MAHWSADALRNRRAGQQRIRRRCKCGRIITGNVGWWSHTHTQDGAERPGHGYDGRA